MLNPNNTPPSAPELSILIPIYNEEQNIKPLYTALKRILFQLKKTHEIIFVDDGSTDASLTEIISIKMWDPVIKIIKFRKNFGQTAALDAGFKQTKGRIIITLDGDLQNDPTDIPLLLAKLNEGFAVVSGWRAKRKDTFSKKLFSRLACKLRRCVIADKVHDSGCMLKAYTREAIQHLDLYGEMHRYIPAILSFQGFKIAEVKVHHHPRKYGTTKYNFKRLPKGFFDLLFIKFWNDYSSRPLHFFGFVAIGQYALAALVFIEQIIKAIIIRELIAGPLFIISVLLVITGTLTFLFGFLAEIMIRTYYRSTKNYHIEKIYL